MRTITKDTQTITTSLGDYEKELVTPEFTYFVNYLESDDNGATKMYRNSTMELVSDNYFATQDFLRALFEDEHIFISEEAKENIVLIAKEDFNLIDSDVELKDDDSDNTYDVYVNEEETHFIAISGDKFFRYKLTKEISSLSKEEEFRILNYCYCLIDSDDEVTLTEVFMQGQFVELIK